MNDHKYSIEFIRKGNDELRKSLKTDLMNKVVLTRSVHESIDRDLILEAVRGFDDFNSSNDPYGEHDGALFKVNNKTYFWKIDYYDHNLEYGVDPKEELPFRLLTIMEASER